jgi:hypothetical protein
MRLPVQAQPVNRPVSTVSFATNGMNPSNTCCSAGDICTGNCTMWGCTGSCIPSSTLNCGCGPNGKCGGICVGGTTCVGVCFSG